MTYKEKLDLLLDVDFTVYTEEETTAYNIILDTIQTARLSESGDMGKKPAKQINRLSGRFLGYKSASCLCSEEDRIHMRNEVLTRMYDKFITQ